APKKAEAAALAFQVRPSAHESALLISQMSVLDLQHTFARVRAPAKNFQDQASTVEHFGVPCLLQIALLHWRQRAIHHHDTGLFRLHDAGALLDLAFAHEGRGPDVVDRDDSGGDDRKIDCTGKPDSFLELGFRRTQREARKYLCSVRRSTAQMRFNYDRAA